MIYYGMYLNFEADKQSLNKWNVLIFLLFYNDLDLNNQKSLCLPSIFRFERKLGFLTTLLNGKQLFIFNKFWSFDPTVHCQQMLYIWSSSRKIWEKLAIQRRQIHKKLLKTVKSDIEFLRGWITGSPLIGRFLGPTKNL